MNRLKKQVNIDQDTLMKAGHICGDFEGFTDGIRVMFLVHRSKDDGQNKMLSSENYHKKLVSRDSKEFQENLYTLLLLKSKSEVPLRIYASVNARDMRKSIRKFRIEQLESDYYDTESSHNFYLDVKNRFISALMTPSSAATSYFIIDIDDRSEIENVLKTIADADLNENIKKQYATKNGWHIIMAPFNPDLLGAHSSKIHKDSVMLLDY